MTGVQTCALPILVQGKPQTLFSSIVTYVTELVDIEEIPKIFNQTYKLNIDKDNVKNEFRYYLPNSYNKFNQRGGLIPRSLLRNKLFQNVDEVIY